MVLFCACSRFEAVIIIIYYNSLQIRQVRLEIHLGYLYIEKWERRGLEQVLDIHVCGRNIYCR